MRWTWKIQQAFVLGVIFRSHLGHILDTNLKLHNIIKVATKIICSKIILVIFGLITGSIALFVGLSGEEKV